MGILIQPRAATYSDPYNPDYPNWLQRLLTGGDAPDSGVRVTERTALRNPTVWKCVRARSESFGMLPKKIYERREILGRDGRIAAKKHELYRLVHFAPNPMLTSMALMEMISADLDTWGNSYAWIQRGAQTGRVQALWRLRPDLVRIDDTSDQLWYYVRSDDGASEETFFPEEILHVRGLGFDGVRGYSPVRMTMDAIGWSEATRRHGAVFFKNASRMSGLVVAPTPIRDPKVKEDILESLKMSGKKAGSLGLLEGGLDFKSLTMPNNEAQFIETIQYQEEDICGIFRVPPHKVGILRRSTNNNIEHQDIEWVRDSIQPICERVEQWFNLQLLSGMPSSGLGGGTAQDRYFMKCELDGLLRGDTAARTAYYQARFATGSMSQNDIREKEDEPPFEGGDEYWIQLNMVPISMAKELLSQPKESVAAENDDEPVENRVLGELQARFRRAYSHVFRDATGRVMARKPGDREKVVPGLFDRILQGLAEGLNIEPDGEFLTGYLAAMGKRASDWTDADTVTAEELDRAVKALMERGQ